MYFKNLFDEKLPDDYCLTPNEKYSLRKHQEFAIDKFQSKTTKGLLIYYEMGSGKTLIALELAKRLNKKTYLITEKSLNENFKFEMKKFGYKFKYDFIDFYQVNYFYKKNNNKLDFNNSFIIIDECHLMFNNVIFGGILKPIYTELEKANCEILCLTGTPIFENPFELSALFNLLSPSVNLPRDGYTFNKRYYNDVYYTYYRENEFIKKIEGLVLFFPGYTDNINVFPKREKPKYHWHPPGKTMDITINDINRVYNVPNDVQLTRENVKIYSPKIAFVLDEIFSPKTYGKIMVYSKYIDVLNIFKSLLDLSNYKHYIVILNDNLENVKKFNENKEIKIILTNIIHGINLHGVRHVHIMEPPEQATQFNQIIARAARLCSHIMYEPDKRNVNIHLHVTYGTIFKPGIDFSIFHNMYKYYCLIEDFNSLLRRVSIGPVIETDQ